MEITNLENRATALEAKVAAAEITINSLNSKVTTLESKESNKQIDLLSLVYPVGSIYMSVNNASPQTFLGGTWVAWGAGKMPVGQSQSDSLFTSSEATGGSKSSVAAHSHTPTDNISTGSLKIYHACYDSHSPIGTGLLTVSSKNIQNITLTTSGNSRIKESDVSVRMPTVSEFGSNNGNLPPYIVCYMWKRTS